MIEVGVQGLLAVSFQGGETVHVVKQVLWRSLLEIFSVAEAADEQAV